MTANFADPDFEPTDEQLVELSREAFAGVKEAQDRALANIRQQINEGRKAVLARVDAIAKANTLKRK